MTFTDFHAHDGCTYDNNNNNISIIIIVVVVIKLNMNNLVHYILIEWITKLIWKCVIFILLCFIFKTVPPLWHVGWNDTVFIEDGAKWAFWRWL